MAAPKTSAMTVKSARMALGCIALRADGLTILRRSSRLQWQHGHRKLQFQSGRPLIQALSARPQTSGVAEGWATVVMGTSRHLSALTPAAAIRHPRRMAAAIAVLVSSGAIARSTMIRLLLVALAALAALPLMQRPAQAAEPPWCLIGPEGVRALLLQLARRLPAQSRARQLLQPQSALPGRAARPQTGAAPASAALDACRLGANVLTSPEKNRANSKLEKNLENLSPLEKPAS